MPTGGPGNAEPAEMPDAPWLSVSKRAPQGPLPHPDIIVLPVRAIDGAYSFDGVSVILDARDRTIAMVRSDEAAAFVTWRNGRG